MARGAGVEQSRRDLRRADAQQHGRRYRAERGPHVEQPRHGHGQPCLPCGRVGEELHVAVVRLDMAGAYVRERAARREAQAAAVEAGRASAPGADRADEVQPPRPALGRLVQLDDQVREPRRGGVADMKVNAIKLTGHVGASSPLRPVIELARSHDARMSVGVGPVQHGAQECRGDLTVATAARDAYDDGRAHGAGYDSARAATASRKISPSVRQGTNSSPSCWRVSSPLASRHTIAGPSPS